LRESSDATVGQDIQSAPHVLLDVYAPWCGPCKAMTPMLEEFDRTHPDVAVIKINGDENPATMQTYGVSAYPTLILFRDGQFVGNYVGNPGSLAGLEQLLR
jgi:thioredoxin 1